MEEFEALVFDVSLTTVLPSQHTALSKTYAALRAEAPADAAANVQAVLTEAMVMMCTVSACQAIKRADADECATFGNKIANVQVKLSQLPKSVQA